MQGTFNSQSSYYGASNSYSAKNTWEADARCRTDRPRIRPRSVIQQSWRSLGGSNFGFQGTYGSHNFASSTLIGMIIGVGAEYALLKNGPQRLRWTI